jgi:hypothetical protein
MLVPLFDLKFLIEFAAGGEELQIGGTRQIDSAARSAVVIAPVP